MDPIKATILGVIAAFMALLGACSINVVDSGEEDVQVVFGELKQEPLTEGWRLVHPLSDIHTYSVRQERYCFRDLEIPSQDKLKSTAEICVMANFERGMTPSVYEDSGTQKQFINKHLVKKTAEIVRETGKTVENSEEFFMEEVQSQMKDTIRSGLTTYLAPLGMTVKDVQIVDIDLPEQIRRAIENTKDRAEKVRLQEQQLEIVNLEAQERVKKAEADKTASIEQAEAKRIQADAEAYKIKEEAKAQAEANRLLRASISGELVEYVKANRWNGEYPKTMAGSGAELILLQKQ